MSMSSFKLYNQVLLRIMKSLVSSGREPGEKNWSAFFYSSVVFMPMRKIRHMSTFRKSHRCVFSGILHSVTEQRLQKFLTCKHILESVGAKSVLYREVSTEGHPDPLWQAVATLSSLPPVKWQSRAVSVVPMVGRLIAAEGHLLLLQRGAWSCSVMKIQRWEEIPGYAWRATQGTCA